MFYDRKIVIDCFSDENIKIANDFIEQGGRYIILSEQCPKGKPPFAIPWGVMVEDHRYGSPSFVRGNHSRIEGIWPQYSHLDTGLQRNITFSDVISDETPIENWKSQPYQMQDAPLGVGGDLYHNQHNHYQNLHSEVWNFSKNLNGVAFWGDSAALVPGAKSWGAFFSARSWPLKWSEYTPASVSDYKNEEFDAALVGVEVDVLNAGLPWAEKSPLLPTPMAKIGVQIVGFGHINTAAIEIRNEDTESGEKSPENRRGAWSYGIVARNTFSSKGSVLKVEEDGKIARGVDFDKVLFSEGALRISSEGKKGGIVFNDSNGGEIYSQKESDGDSLVIKLGGKGMSILSQDGKKEIIKITSEGWILVNPDDIRIHSDSKVSGFKGFVKEMIMSFFK